MTLLPQLLPRLVQPKVDHQSAEMMDLDPQVDPVLTHSPRPPPPLASSRTVRHRNARISEDQWNEVKAEFIRLYIDEGCSLKDAMEFLKSQHGFTATRNQFNFMIKKWKVDKKAKGSEMQHIIKIRNRRLGEDPPKRTSFRLRRRPVQEAKIQRFEQEHAIASRLSSCTPSVISWRSPTPTDSAWMRFVKWSPSPSVRQIREPNDGNVDQKLTQSPLSSSEIQRSPGNRSRLGTSPFSLRSSVVRDFDTFIEQIDISNWELGYDPQSHEHFSSRENHITHMSPPLQDCEWWRPYGEWYSSRDTSTERHSWIFELLQGAIIQTNTYENEMLDQRNLQKFEIVKAELAPHGIRLSRRDTCPICRTIGLLDYLDCRTSGELAVSCELDPRWCASEIAGAVASMVADPEDGYRYVEEAIIFLYVLCRHCLSEGLRSEATVFTQMATALVDFLLAEYLRINFLPAGYLRILGTCLLVVGFALFARDFENAETMLRKIMNQSFGSFPDSFPNSKPKIVPVVLGDEERCRVLYEMGVDLFNIVKWFQSNPQYASNAFRCKHLSHCSETTDSISIGNSVYCIRGLGDEVHWSEFFEEMWLDICQVDDSSESETEEDQDDFAPLLYYVHCGSPTTKTRIARYPKTLRNMFWLYEIDLADDMKR